MKQIIRRNEGDVIKS